MPRALLVRVQLPGQVLRIEREDVTQRHVYFINDQEVTVNEYLAVT